MIQKNVLSPVSKKDENLVIRPLGMNWILKIKENGIYCSLIVSKGFLQR